jgi:hypothetical protein
MLEHAKRLEILGNSDAASAARDTALGLLSECAYDFLDANQPDNLCNNEEFLKAFMEIATVIGENFSGDIDCIFRDRFISISEQCQFVLPPYNNLSKIPFGSRMLVILEAEHIYPTGRDYYKVEITVKITRIPSLLDILGTKEDFEIDLVIFNIDGFYENRRQNLVLMLDPVLVESERVMVDSRGENFRNFECSMVRASVMPGLQILCDSDLSQGIIWRGVPLIEGTHILSRRDTAFHFNEAKATIRKL